MILILSIWNNNTYCMVCSEILLARTSHTATTPTKVLVTSRLDLAGSPSTRLDIAGLNREEFEDYVTMISHELNVLHVVEDKAFVKELHARTEGSPTFANSILRLISLGENPRNAASSWSAGDGEEVRRFAFERELTNIDGQTAMVLYAACLLQTPTLNSLSQNYRFAATESSRLNSEP